MLTHKAREKSHRGAPLAQFVETGCNDGAILGCHQSDEAFVPHGLQRAAQNLDRRRTREHDLVVRSEFPNPVLRGGYDVAQLLRGASTLHARLHFPQDPLDRRHEPGNIVLEQVVHRAAAQRLDGRFLPDGARQKYERHIRCVYLGYPERREAVEARQREIRHDHVRSKGCDLVNEF